MAAWRNRGKGAFEQFKAFAQNTRRYETGRPLAGYAYAENLLYAANPVYIEVSQGSTSPARGFGALMWLGLVGACWFGFYTVVEFTLDDISNPNHSPDLLLMFMAVVILVGSIIPLMLLAINFLAPLDAVIRFDRKRQVVYKWSDQGLIEIPWADLTPVVQGMATSPMQASRTYRGMFVEYAPDGEPRSTRGVPHLMQIGPPTGGEEGALFFMEYVRSYMDDGLQSVPRPKRWLRLRPGWRAMFNFAGIVDDWEKEQVKSSELGKPWGLALFFGVGSLFLFPMQVTHWLALKVAPRTRWPKSLLEMHAQDLTEAGCLPDGSRDRTRKRAPVVRVNGERIEPPTQDQSTDNPLPSTWIDRLAAMTAVPMVMLSPLVFWVGGFGYLSFFSLGIYEAAFWSAVLGMTATAIALLSVRYVRGAIEV